MLEYVLLLVPVVFLVGSMYYAYKTVALRKHTKKKALTRQIAAFALVGAMCVIGSLSVSAATGDAAPAVDGMSAGMGYLAAALATGISGIGGGIAVGNAAPAAIGATSEDPKAFGKALIFVALGEGVALYGLLVSILIINKI